MIRTVSTVTAAAVLLAFSNLFAQTGASVPTPPVPAPPSDSTANTAPTMEDKKKGDKHWDGDDHEGKGRGKGKHKRKGPGKDDGLDRAEEVAGEYGKPGRDKARSRGKRGKD